MNDPVAEAAAKIAADGAPSSTEPTGIVGEMINEFHKLEDKVEHLMHHGAEAGSATSGETLTPVIPSGSGSDATAVDANSTSTIVAEQTSASTAATTGSSDLGNAAAVIVPSDNATAASAEGSAAADPNGVTGTVVLPVITASALGESIPAGIQGVVETAIAEPAKLVSSISSAVLDRIAAIKKHLSIRGFEQSAVADIHSELDAIERLL